MPALQNFKNSKNLTIGSKITEIVITESFAKPYPMYVFMCQSIIDENTNQSMEMEWYTEDDIKFSRKSLYFIRVESQNYSFILIEIHSNY
jgi:hypothetical protein